VSSPWPDAATAIDDAPCGLLQADEAGAIFWANRTFCRWTGFSAEEITARRFQDLLTMGGRIFHQTHWYPLLLMQGSVSEVKLELVQRDGQALPAIVNAFLRDRGGRRIQEVAVYVARDRDKYERELVAARRRIEETLAITQRLRDEAKDRAHFAEQMMGIVSHDLRNPLSVIHMSMAVLERTSTTAQQQSVIARVARSTERANRLIAELLDFTQARLGNGIAVSRRPHRLKSLVHDTVEELRHAFPKRVIAHVHEGIDADCSLDPDRIAQALGNLVGNAVTYGSEEHPVTVTSKVLESEWEVTVHNFGSPIPGEDLAKIFLPLERGDKVDAGGRSVGLGLYIVSEIARAHDGRVSVRSNKESGTQFSICVPR
jgi:phosphoserine phosphatase RsbU/P